MSTLAEIEAAILGLPPQDKLRLVEWFDEHSEDLTPVTEDQQSEIRRRADELLAQPGLAQPLTPAFFDRLRGKIADVRAAQASPR